VQHYIQEKKTLTNKLKYGLLSVILFITILLWWIVQLKVEHFPVEFNQSYAVNSLSETVKISGLGTIIPRTKNLLAATDSGQVSQLFVRAGQTIQKGDVIATITNYSLAQEVDTAKYNLINIRSEVELKKNELLMKKYQLESNLAKAKTSVRKEQLEFEANGLMAKKGILSKIKFKQSEMSYEQVKVDVESWKHQIILFNSIYQLQRDALDAKVATVTDQLKFLQDRIAALTIKANVTGIISEVLCNEGQAVNQGQLLFELVDTTKLIAKVQIPQYSSTHIQLEQSATIITPNGEISGTIEHIDKVIRQGAVSIYIAFIGIPPQWIKTEQSIEAVINTDQQKTRLLINAPNNYNDYEHWVIYKKDYSGKAIKTNIEFVGRSSQYLFLGEQVSRDDILFILPKHLSEDMEYEISEES